MRFGRVKAIYGVISISAIATYIAISKIAKRRKLLVALVEDNNVPDADILVFNGISVFIDSSTKLNSDMVAVVCAGPLQLTSLPNLRPLDFYKEVSYEFNLISPNYSNVIKATREKGNVPVKEISIDNLAMIINNVTEGGVILTSMNSLFSMCNMQARNIVKSKLANFILGKVDLKDVIEAVEGLRDKNIDDRVTSLISDLKSKDFFVLAKSISEVLKDKTNAQKIVKKHGFDSFEISYLLKMVREIRRVEKRYGS